MGQRAVEWSLTEGNTLSPYCLASRLAVFVQVDIVCNYHVGETIMSLQKTTLVPGGSECIVYTTMSGGVGILVPFASKEVVLILVVLFHLVSDLLVIGYRLLSAS